MKIVDVAELTAEDAAFIDLHDLDGETVCWERFSAIPRNFVERRITRPRLSRYRAAWEASGAARDATALISHLPLMSLATCNALRLRQTGDVFHIAFSFNFTRLPTGARLQRFRKGLSAVDNFAVYTEFEKELYSSTFDIPRDRFSRLDWTQQAPIVGDLDTDFLPDRPFVAAIGGEGRDYKLLLAMARAMPQLPFVLIARPDPIFSDLPPNVQLFCNIPSATCWAIAVRSSFVLVPLRDAETCCGHITLVSARLAGIPIITSRSAGTREYSEGYRATLIAEPGRLDNWTELLIDAMHRSGELREIAEEERRIASIRHDRRHWKSFVENLLREHGGG